MAFNPFLNIAESEPAELLNPFMTGDAEPAPFAGDNPFAASNPFADFGGFEPAAGDTVPVDVFGGPHPPAGAGSAFPPAASKPTELGLPPGTHDLILSVTGQMDFASSHLLDRIPPTRTPSPVSARDIHSPSPTPDPEPELELDPEPAAVPGGDLFDVNRNKPPRPPPARPSAAPARAPPPRPAPPPVPAPVAAPAPAPTDVDDINLFDAPVPTAVKPTKEAILSLYSAPRKEEERPIDFLSDDIPEQEESTPFGAFIGEPSRRPSEVERNPFESGADDGAAASPFSEPNIFAASPLEATFETAVEATSPTAAFEQPANTDAFDSASSATAFEITPNVFGTTGAADDVLKSTKIGNEYEKTVPEAFDSVMPDASLNFTAPSTGAYDSASNANIFEAASNANIFEAASNTNVYETVANVDTFGTASNANVFDIAPSESNIFETGSTADIFETPSNANVFEVSTGNAFETTSTPNAFQSNSNRTDAFESTPAARVTAGGPDAFETMQCDSTEPATSSPFDSAGQADFPATSWGAAPEPMTLDAFPESQDAFDAFSAKFDSTAEKHLATGAWGDDGSGAADEGSGFEAEAFDPFLSMGAPPAPAATPRLPRDGSADSADDSFSVFIRPKEGDVASGPAPALAPPPRPQPPPEPPRANPFDRSAAPPAALPHLELGPSGAEGEEEPRPGSGGETPPTPLFDEDTTVPLEEFPRTRCTVPGWEMQLRQPNKKKITGQRFWKKVFVRLAYQGDNPVVQLFNAAGDKEPFQELPLQACYSVSEVGAQQFDQFGKIFTVKLQYVFYKERPGVRPGQVTKAERITNKLSQFAAYAIQGDYQGVKEFGSDLRKLGLPVEHAPQVSQLFKLGSLAYEDVKQFSCCVEEALFRLPAHRDRALHYKMEEVQVTAVDELYVEQDADGAVLKQIARVRLFFLGFLSGMPDVELGVNDLRRQGKEVVGRHDIIPVVTEEWIRVEDTEFHACVQPDEFTATQIIKFKPPDACYIELMRFRVRPPKNRELPLQLKAVWCVTGNKVELRADVLVPGFASRKLGQVPCEDVAIRFPIPECWIYLFRVEKHFRYGSVKSAHRRTGKIKGIERFLGAVDTLQESLIEVTSGQAKYEHQHRAIVWRMPRLPKEGQGAYTTHNLVCRMALTSYDQVPEELARWAHVEFTMPATQVSHMTVRSVSLQNHDNDPPEKYVRYLARHEYIVGIERTSGQAAPAYAIAASAERAPPAPPPAPVAPQPPSSDSESE